MTAANIIISLMQKFSWILVVLILFFGWTSPILMLLTLTCMIFPIIFSFTYGRAWCGNFCPRGSFAGAVLSIISPKKQIPKLFKSNLFRILILILVMALFINGLSQPHPTLTCLGKIFIKMIAITTIIQIGLAIFINSYAWCAICPMGTISNYIAKARGIQDHIKITEECISCYTCTKNCPSQIDIPSWRTKGKILDADCLKCRECIKSCPKKCLQYSD